MATVLVIGASKGIGLETVKAALKAGHTVRAMARSAGRILIRNPNLEKISGDALDHATVKAALEGVDAAVQTLGVAAGPGMMLKPVRLFSDATRLLVTAMKETEVNRLISVTGFWCRGQPPSRRLSLQCCLRAVPPPGIRGQGRTGGSHPGKRARLGDRSSGHPDQRIADGQIPRPH